MEKVTAFVKRLAAHDGAKPLREILPPVLSIKLCRDPRLSIWSKNKGGGGGGGNPGHFAGSATGSYLVYVTRYKFRSFSSLSLALFFHAGLFH